MLKPTRMIKKLLSLLVILLSLVNNTYASISTSTCYGTDAAVMLHMDGSDASTTFTDSSDDANSYTANGDAQIDTAQSKFGGAAGLGDGTGDFVSTGSGAEFNVGTGDFTLDYWMRQTSLGEHWIGVFESGTCSQFCLASLLTSPASPETITLYTDGGSTTRNPDFVINTWYHIAITRSGTDLRLFVDGTQVGATITNSANMDDNAGFRALGYDSLNFEITGWMDEVRFVVGTAVWTGNFTPPTAAYTDCDAVVASDASGVGSVGSNPSIF